MCLFSENLRGTYRPASTSTLRGCTFACPARTLRVGTLVPRHLINTLRGGTLVPRHNSYVLLRTRNASLASTNKLTSFILDKRDSSIEHVIREVSEICWLLYYLSHTITSLIQWTWYIL